MSLNADSITSPSFGGTRVLTHSGGPETWLPSLPEIAQKTPVILLYLPLIIYIPASFPFLCAKTPADEL